MTHLWEIDHPYYAQEGNYFKNGFHEVYGSWDEFAQPTEGVSLSVMWAQPEGTHGPNLLYDFDDDLNYLWRWDWKRADPDDYEPDEDLPGDTLMLFFMQQRKARCNSAEITVTEADEPAVHEWLTKKAAHVARVWQPFLSLATATAAREVI